MSRNKINKTTKKLQNLLKEKNTSLIIYKHGSLRQSSKTSGNSVGSENYSYYNYN